MAGVEKNIIFGNGFKLQPSAAGDIALTNHLATDISFLNITGSPAGVVSANPSSLTFDVSTGNIYRKSSGTGTAGWVLLNSAPVIPTAGAAGTILRSDGANWQVSSNTYPDTNSINTLLYASAANTMSALATANNGMLVTSSAGVPSILAGPGTTGNMLQANAAAAPSFSTTTYPSTNAISTLLYASAANVMAALATANNGLLVTSSTGVPSILAGPGVTGKILQSTAAAAPAFSTATYPGVGTSTGSILRADGTNWSATTTTYPNTNAISTLLYASAANVMSALATANNGLLVTSSTGVPSILAGPGATGRILQSNAAAAPSFSTATYPSTAGTAGFPLISDGTNIVAATGLKISSGIMTNTLQPILTAQIHTAQTNVTGDGTSFDVIFDSILAQQGSNYNTGTGKFTCPVTGYYLVTYTVTFTGITAAMNDGLSQILSSAATITRRSWNAGVIRTAANESVISDCTVTSRNASDTLYINIAISNGAKVASTKPDSFGSYGYLSIYLIA
jgi:hypothetical protein